MTASEARRSSSTLETAPILTTPRVTEELVRPTVAQAASVPSVFGGRHALRPSGKVLPEHARNHNRALVLQTIYASGAQSRADIARETGLTRVTVSELVSQLIAERLVVELGQREAARPGKPATMLDIDRGAFHIVAIDLSEKSTVRGGVLDLDGVLLERRERELGDAKGDAVVDILIGLLDELLGLAGAPVLGIGIGSPGIVDAHGVVCSAPNLGWYGLPLHQRLVDRFDMPVHVANDANVAVLAEHSSRGTGDLLLIRVGRGVGAGLIVGGHPVVGSASAAGEIGHVVVGTDGGPLCACGTHGCLEAWLAEPRLREAIAASPEADAQATSDILREAGRRLGIVLAPVVGALNLSEVVLSGPADLLDGELSRAAIETLRKRTMAEFNRDLRLRMTSLGPDIVLRGAAVMVLSGQLGVS